MENQKADNMLNLAWDATPSERERSLNLNTGYNQIERTWDVIIKYNGDISLLLRNFESKNIKIVPPPIPIPLNIPDKPPIKICNISFLQFYKTNNILYA